MAHVQRLSFIKLTPVELDFPSNLPGWQIALYWVLETGLTYLLVAITDIFNEYTFLYTTYFLFLSYPSYNGSRLTLILAC